MKVYFSSSMRAKRMYGEFFAKIYKTIVDLGYKHTSDFLIKADPDKFYQDNLGEEKKFYESMVGQIKSADVCVFEVSFHSLGLGYCVNMALDFGKPVILLYQKGKKPYLFSAVKNDKLKLVEYGQDTLHSVLKDVLEEAKESIDIRFTFFITPKINQFLRHVARTKKTPRAVFLRELLEKEMKKQGF